MVERKRREKSGEEKQAEIKTQIGKNCVRNDGGENIEEELTRYLRFVPLLYQPGHGCSVTHKS